MKKINFIKHFLMLFLYFSFFISFVKADDLTKLNTFMSNFVEISNPKLLQKNNLVLFAIDHVLINAPQKIQKLANGKFAISQDLAQNILQRYFGNYVNLELQDAKFNNFLAIYDKTNRRFIFDKSQQTALATAEITKIEKHNNNEIFVSGNVKNKNANKKFTALLSEQQFKGKKSFVLVRLWFDLSTTEIAKMNIENLFYDADDFSYLGEIGNDGSRFRIKFLTVEKFSNNTLKTNGVIKIANDEIQTFNGFIKIQQAKNNIFDYELENMADYKNLNPGSLFTTLELKGNNFSIDGKMNIDFVRKNNLLIIDKEFIVADGWQNNQFIGTFTQNQNNTKKNLAFGLGRIPFIKGFAAIDVGAGEFIPDEKYLDKGWKSYKDLLLEGSKNEKIKNTEIFWYKK